MLVHFFFFCGMYKLDKKKAKTTCIYYLSRKLLTDHKAYADRKRCIGFDSEIIYSLSFHLQV